MVLLSEVRSIPAGPGSLGGLQVREGKEVWKGKRMGANWDLKWILVHKVGIKMGSLYKSVK